MSMVVVVAAVMAVREGWDWAGVHARKRVLAGCLSLGLVLGAVTLAAPGVSAEK